MKIGQKAGFFIEKHECRSFYSCAWEPLCHPDPFRLFLTSPYSPASSVSGTGHFYYKDSLKTGYINRYVL